MLKKLLFLGLLISILINFNHVSAETSLIIPLKKPFLNEEAQSAKISQGMLKPKHKPSKKIKKTKKNTTKI